MNFDQAKAIAMSLILEKLDFQPTKEDETDATYFSPWREEKTPSFHLNKKDNVWYDHGEGKGGGNIEFVCRLLKHNGEDHTRVDALRWFNNMFGENPAISNKPIERATRPGWRLIREEPLENLALIRYLEKRKIDVALAKEHLLEVYVKSKKTNEYIYALGFKNEDGGYELRNSFLKSCIAPKSITFIRSTTEPENSRFVHLFEGFMDYLTFLTLQKGQHKGDVIVLNSVNCLNKAISYITKFRYVRCYSWLDHDDAGRKATKELEEFFKTQEHITHKKRNKIYAGFKDLNEWHVKKPKKTACEV